MPRLAPPSRACDATRVLYSDETRVRINGKRRWNWVLQNGDVVIHVVRASRGAHVVAEVLDSHGLSSHQASALIQFSPLHVDAACTDAGSEVRRRCRKKGGDPYDF